MASLLFSSAAFAQSASTKSFVDAVMQEETANSQLETLSHQLFDGVGPRLVGTPQMAQAGDWAVSTYKKWGISAKKENWGVWRGWERGISHIDMISPRIKSLEGTQLAWSPAWVKKL